jgi:hypothetical protein
MKFVLDSPFSNPDPYIGVGCQVPGIGCQVSGIGCRVPGTGWRVPEKNRILGSKWYLYMFQGLRNAVKRPD